MTKSVFFATGLQLRKIKTKKKKQTSLLRLYFYKLELIIGVHARDNGETRWRVCVCVEVTPQEVPAGVNTRVYYFLLLAKWSEATSDGEGVVASGSERVSPTRVFIGPYHPSSPSTGYVSPSTNPFDSYKTGGAGTRDYPPCSYIAFDHSGRGFNIKFFRLGRAL